MTTLPNESICIIGESIGISNINEEAIRFLIPEVELRLLEIIQEALKFTSHSRRTILTTNDINAALRTRNFESLYGFSTNFDQVSESFQWKKDGQIFIYDEKEIDLKDIINQSIPNHPSPPTFHIHWFAIEGIQPNIPENKLNHSIPSPTSLATSIMESNQTKIKTSIVKHVVSDEMQEYYHLVIKTILNDKKKSSNNNNNTLKKIYTSLRSDPGLQPLVPYFTFFLYEQIRSDINIDNINILLSLLKMIKSLLENNFLNLELYLHQILPSLLTCLLASNITAKGHWRLRDYASTIIAFIIKKYGHIYDNLLQRISSTFHSAIFSNERKSLRTKYGAIRGITALGPLCIELLLLHSIKKMVEKDLSFLYEKPNKDDIKKDGPMIMRKYDESRLCQEAFIDALRKYLKYIMSRDKNIIIANKNLLIMEEIMDYFGETFHLYFKHDSLELFF